MKLYAITDFDFNYTEQWLTKKDVEETKKQLPYCSIIPIQEAKEKIRICSECGRVMTEGYCIENGLDYYCSDECLHKNMTQEEYLELYDDGNGDSYYTEWSE